MNLLLQSKFNT